jgi:hypothetical protein
MSKKGYWTADHASGIEHCQQENVPVALEASVVGRRLYQKLGFQTIQRTRLAERVEGLQGGVAMLWEPDPLKGRWIKELDDGSVKLRKI